jgi:Fe-S cluster assembly protein SufD|tara:strand:- start:2491 stop:3735 length:1245 start_codon:yes stop_codon:yes gene_type:complete
MEKRIKIDFEKTFKNNSRREDINFRKLYLKKFLKDGFPSKKLENWKFSDLNQIINNHIGGLNFYNNFSKKNKINNSIFINEFEHNKIIFINGKLEETDFKFEEKNKIKLSIKTKKDEKKSDANSLESLNNALNSNCYKISIKSNYFAKKPLVVYHITNGELKLTNINLQLNFSLEKNSSLKIIDIFNDDSEKNFVNIFYNFDLKQDAILKNFKIDKIRNNNIKYSYNNIEQDENSVSETFILSCGSKFMKNEINCNLNGKYSSAFVNGIFSLNKQNHHEIRTSVNHLTENTKSYQLIKSVLDDNAKAVYQGKIYVNSQAQKTDGYQLSKAILLNESTEFNAKPELEIYADDVKCSHGSASGSLNESSIFYLRSRGLSFKEAKNLLINGFLLDVIEKITDEEIKIFIKKTMGLKQ